MNSDDHQRIEIHRATSEILSNQIIEIDLLADETSPTDNDKELFDKPTIFIEPIIEHQWDQRSFVGHLVVCSGDFVAYALKPQSGDDIVCVFYKQVDFRSVINPPFIGDIEDLAFSYSTDLLLSCIDQASHLRIYRIEKLDEPNELEHTLIVHLDLELNSIGIVTWCCLIPDQTDDEDDDDLFTMMSVTCGSKVEVFNVDRLAEKYLPETILRFDEVQQEHLTYSDHKGNVTCVCFSPDGTALGTATDQGEIKFFSINFNQTNSCRCLHVWIPHEGRPISSLFFLDDHSNLTQETQLWRYAVTACDNNREFKVWSCTNWSCLQVLRFQNASISLKVSIDLTSRFLVLSDLHRNSLYVLTICQDVEQNFARFSSFHSFPPLSSAALSLTITAANQLFDSNSTRRSDDSMIYAVKLFSIQNRCFQEILLVMKTQRFMPMIETENLDDNQLVELRRDFRFEPLMNFLRNESQTPLIPLATYSIDDLLTPSSQDGLTNENRSTGVTDSLHGLLLGNSTAFDHDDSTRKLINENGNPSLSPPKYPPIENYSDPIETSDKDNDSTADEDAHLHSRSKRRTGRSPNSSITADILHEIRQLTDLLRDDHSRRFSSDSDEKLEQCCQQLDELTMKVDRLINIEPIKSRPSPNLVSVDVFIDKEELTEVHYDRLENFLREKIPTTMNSIFEPYQQLKDQLHKDLAGKLLATDNVMKQTIGQMFRSKNTIDSLSQSVTHAIQSMMVTTYRDTFNQTVIPSFEKAATNMFQQTNDVFKRGTKEYLQELIEYGRQQQRTLIQQREQMISEVKKECLLLSKEVERRNQQTIDGLKSDLNEPLIDLIRQKTQTILRDETTEVFRDYFTQQKVELEQILRQSTPTPTINDLHQQRVVEHLRQGQYNRAFEFALSASDLSLVLFVCEQISAKDLFSIQPCPLKDNVLLSLIQQLSADLTTDQLLKYQYLTEALISFDLSHSNLRDYLQTVLTDLTKRLTIYLQTHPNDSMTKRFQLLWMTSQGLVQKLLSYSS